MDDSTGILRQMLQNHAKHAEEAEAIGSNNAAWHRNRCRALQAAITALEPSPAHTSEARDALLKELKWRMGDIREMLMSRGIGDNAIYGCDEWSTPTVNLASAIELINAAMRQEAGDV